MWIPEENDAYRGAPHEPLDPDIGYNSTARKVVEFCTARGLVEEVDGETVYCIPERNLAELQTDDSRIVALGAVADKVTNGILHVLRNPWGHDEFVIREARLTAANLIEVLQRSEEQRVQEIDRLSASLKTVVNHWREFGPEHGFDECVERFAAWVLKP